MFFEGYTEKLWGRHPREISADWGSQRVKGLSITAILLDIAKKAIPGLNKGEVETSLIEEFSYPKYGPGQLWETAAHDFLDMGGEIRIALTADGFLYHMVRIIVGTLLEVGEGKRAAEDIGAVLASRDRMEAGPTAPAQGLTLWQVKY